MKKEIDKIRTLAERYVEFGKSINLPDGHNTIRSPSKQINDRGSSFHSVGKDIKIYFSDNYETWTVRFSTGQPNIDLRHIEVVGYRKSIDMSWDLTKQDIGEIYTDVETHLEEFLLPRAESFKISEKAKHLDEILRLEIRIEELKELI